MFKNNIILIGPMGTGKTTVGRYLSRKLDRKFYDSDQEIEKSTGTNISWIFKIEGEAGFRKRESKIIEILLSKENIVLSTGGGTILSRENRELISNNRFIIYLNSPLDKLYARVSHDKNRPLLGESNNIEEMRKIFREREPYYRSLANMIINTNKLSVKRIVNKIVRLVTLNESS